MVNFFEKTAKNQCCEIAYDLEGFIQDGFDREVYDRQDFYRERFKKWGLNRNKEVADTEKKIKLALKMKPWNIHCAKDNYSNSFEIMNKCLQCEPNTYQNSSPEFTSNIQLALLFLRQGGSFSLLNRHLRNNDYVGSIALDIFSENFHYLVKNLKDDDDILDLAVKLVERIRGNAIEILRISPLSLCTNTWIRDWRQNLIL